MSDSEQSVVNAAKQDPTYNDDFCARCWADSKQHKYKFKCIVEKTCVNLSDPRPGTVQALMICPECEFSVTKHIDFKLSEL